MILFLKQFISFLAKANSEADGTPSQTRLIGSFTALLFGLVLAYGFIHSLVWYPYLIVEYALILAMLVASLAGIKTLQTIKTGKQ